jgi:predicted glycosyltransferase
MNIKTEAKTILIAPLNWGLGHATRCIPIIRALLKNNYIPIMHQMALALLHEKSSPVQTLELPSYHVEYAENANFKWKLIQNGQK